MNRELEPQFSTTYEIGAKGLVLSRVQYDVALFNADIRDELIPFATASSAGRMFYRNAGRTRRQGAELMLMTDVGPVTLNSAYSLSHFRFRTFETATAKYDGNAIPGIPEHQLQLGATARFGKQYLVAEMVAKSEVWANDANAVAAPGFAVFNIRAGGMTGRLSPVVAVQNLFDTRYVGSVAVNAAGASVAVTKFYEPAPRRTFYVGLSATTTPW